jgi:hypothetical protein
MSNYNRAFRAIQEPVPLKHPNRKNEPGPHRNTRSGAPRYVSFSVNGRVLDINFETIKLNAKTLSADVIENIKQMLCHEINREYDRFRYNKKG